MVITRYNINRESDYVVELTASAGRTQVKGDNIGVGLSFHNFDGKLEPVVGYYERVSGSLVSKVYRKVGNCLVGADRIEDTGTLHVKTREGQTVVTEISADGMLSRPLWTVVAGVIQIVRKEPALYYTYEFGRWYAESDKHFSKPAYANFYSDWDHRSIAQEFHISDSDKEEVLAGLKSFQNLLDSKGLVMSYYREQGYVCFHKDLTKVQLPEGFIAETDESYSLRTDDCNVMSIPLPEEFVYTPRLTDSGIKPVDEQSDDWGICINTKVKFYEVE